MAGPIDNPYGKPIPPPYGDVKSLSHPSYGDVPVDEPLPKEAWDKKAKGFKGEAKKATEKGMSKFKAAGKAASAATERGAQAIRQFADDAAQNTRRGLPQVLKKAPGAVAQRAGSLVLRAAPFVYPVTAGMLGRDIYVGAKDPDFMTGLINIFGGEEKAYNQWAAQEAEEGNDMPSYEEYRARAEEMVQAGELDANEIEEDDPPWWSKGAGYPDTREVAKSALAPRHAQEMHPDDME